MIIALWLQYDPSLAIKDACMTIKRKQQHAFVGWCYSSALFLAHFHYLHNNPDLSDPVMGTPDSIDAKFYHTSRKCPERTLLDESDPTTWDRFEPSKQTFFIIHGFKGSSRKTWVENMASELLSKEDANVIAVDWEKGASAHFPEFYTKAAKNTEIVGAIIAEFTKNIEEYRNAENTNIHLIGHSLGAHVAGFAGKKFLSSYNRIRYQRITGLDPAGPYFQESCEMNCKRLGRGDAMFVDVIHTNGGNYNSDILALINGKFGILKPIGNVDFYLNGGQNQPGCKTGISSHSRAHRWFTESISSTSRFMAFPFESLEACLSGKVNITTTAHGKMGYNTDTRLNNQLFYVET